MPFAALLSRAIERRHAERRLLDRREKTIAAPFPERRMGPRRAGEAMGPTR